MELNNIYIDIGSRTTKSFIVHGGKLETLKDVSINFNEDYTSELGIPTAKKEEIFKFVRDLRDDNPSFHVKTFATAFFRKLPKYYLGAITQEFFEKTGVRLDVLSQDRENDYLIRALFKNCPDTLSLLVNIGGGSTELGIIRNKNVLEKINIDWGINYILSNFPRLNDVFSGHASKEIISFIKNRIPERNYGPIPFAFNTGGELSYVQLMHYPLEKNTLFLDEDHPFMISVGDYAAKNSELLERTPLQLLEASMPQNPKRMHSARAASVIAQAICEKFKVQFVIPSDADTIHGIFQEDMESLNP